MHESVDKHGSRKRFLTNQWRWGACALGLAAAIWLPSVHFFFQRSSGGADDGRLSTHAQELAARQMELWTKPELREREVAKMRMSNAEWDFMGRSFLVWSLGEMALREPTRRDECLKVMDRIIDETLAVEAREGMYFFLMPYAKARPFVRQPARSQFIDGEIALMLAVRRVVEEKPEYRAIFRERIEGIAGRMRQSSLLSCESYPDECWTFCNTVALATIRMGDYLDGTTHLKLMRDWVLMARKHLVDPTTGLLVTTYTLEGGHLEGPEGSSIWMTVHCLRLVDEGFARDQYERARKEIGGSVCGFGYAREWPKSWKGAADVDSGPIIPILGASAGSSGLALVAASSFKDEEYLKSLRTTLEFGAFPVRKKGELKYCASNQVGDAVMLYADVLGPVWEKVKGGAK